MCFNTPRAHSGLNRWWNKVPVLHKSGGYTARTQAGHISSVLLACCFILYKQVKYCLSPLCTSAHFAVQPLWDCSLSGYQMHDSYNIITFALDKRVLIEYYPVSLVLSGRDQSSAERRESKTFINPSLNNEKQFSYTFVDLFGVTSRCGTSIGQINKKILESCHVCSLWKV